MSADNLPPPPDFSEPVFATRLEQTLDSCSKSIAAGDTSRSDALISDLVKSLKSISESLALDPENEELESKAFNVLSELQRSLTLHSLDQEVIDALSFEIPKAVARFSCASKRCVEISESVIDRFIESCSPRDMVSILCEALGYSGDVFNSPGYYTPILKGLAKVFMSIQRRRFEQVKEAIPVVLRVLEAMSVEPEDEDTSSLELLNKAFDIASSLHAICVKMQQEGKEDKKLSALFGLFVLQFMTLASITMRNQIQKCFSIVQQLSHFLYFCGLSYIGLITGDEVDMISEIISADDDYMSCFSYAKHGAVLAVIWGHVSAEAAIAAKADLDALKVELQGNQTRRWEAIGMLKHIFSFVKLPWELKRHAINFLLLILEGNVSHNNHDEPTDYSIYMPSLYASLQAIQMVMIYASDVQLRKAAFDLSKKILADVPTSLRFDLLVALIKNSDVSSMIALLLGCVKDELYQENRRRNSLGNGVVHVEHNTFQSPSFWRAEVLDLVELILKPPEGGPPSLPECTDAVSSALNLYRFILITESTGKTNYTGVLSKEKLQKAYKEWLQPLSTLVSGIVAECHKDRDELSLDTVLALSPIEFVLYRCIELVEENLKQCT